MNLLGSGAGIAWKSVAAQSALKTPVTLPDPAPDVIQFNLNGPTGEKSSVRFKKLCSQADAPLERIRSLVQRQRTYISLPVHRIAGQKPPLLQALEFSQQSGVCDSLTAGRASGMKGSDSVVAALISRPFLIEVRPT